MSAVGRFISFLGQDRAAPRFLLLSASAALHGAGILSLYALEDPSAAVRRPSQVRFLTLVKPPVPPPAELPAAPVPVDKTTPGEPSRPRISTPRATHRPEPPTPMAAAPHAVPADFRVLTFSGSDAFSMIVGPPNQKASGAGGKRQGGQTAGGRLPARARAPRPRLVPVSDLSRKPSPPALAARLRSNYPVAARQLGKAGEARALVRVDADGKVRHVTLSYESESGFGDACRRTLLGSRWTPPRDKRGRPAATQVMYVCQFRVHD